MTLDLRQRTPYSALPARPPMRLPGGARLAVWVAPNVEHYEYQLARPTDRDPWPRTPHPDVHQYSYRDYGNRQGIWRLDRLFRDFEIPPTFSLNSGMLAYYPEVADLIARSDGAVMAHGVYNTDYLHQLDADEERDRLRASIDDIYERTGKKAGGYLGPGISATVNTPDVLAALGLRYQAEWVLDDQPTPIIVEHGRLISLPYTFELNDARMINDPCSPDQFADACLRQFRLLHREGATSARVMCIALHTFVSGQPHIAARLHDVFDEMRRHDDVWFATGDDIADWYLEHCYDEQLEAVQRTEATPIQAREAATVTRPVPATPGLAAAGERPTTLDHPYPIEPARFADATTTWPGGKWLAISVVVWLDYLDLIAPSGAKQSRWLGGGPGTRPFPDYAKYSHREYGHRVGIFRLLDLLAGHDVSLVVAVDAMTAEHYPALIDELRNREVEWIAHGSAATRMISSAMSDDDERVHIDEVLKTLGERLGVRPTGWLGAEYGESSRTPALLRRAGIEYVCDWGSDDVPFKLHTPDGEIWAVPSLACYDDSFGLEHRKLSPDAFYGGVAAAARALLAEHVAGTPRCMTVNVRPWLTGQPFRTTYFADVLDSLAGAGVWLASPGAIVDALTEGRR
jgi:peptidoglycan/xylan/chitin deacetylase (PgdA/CDA1 family)